MACKLSLCQLRAMVAKIEGTIGTHENRPGTGRNVRELERAQARLQSYRIELDKAEAADREITAQAHAQAAAADTAAEIARQQQHTAAIREADTARPLATITATAAAAAVAQAAADTAAYLATHATTQAAGCPTCNANQGQPCRDNSGRPCAPHGARNAAAQVIANRAQLLADRAADQARADAKAPTVTLPPTQAERRMSIVHPPAGRRRGSDRTPYHTDPDEQPKPDPAGRSAQANADVIAFLRPLLDRYTPGAVSDALWAADRQRSAERAARRNQEATA